MQTTNDDITKVYLAVICALPDETLSLISHQGIRPRREKVKNRRFYVVETGHPSGAVAIFTSGMGKVRSAAETQFAIDHFQPRYIVNFGSAGGVNPERKVGDIVIGEKYVEYDYHSFGDNPPFLAPDLEMVRMAQKLPGAITGLIATADQNGDTPKKKTALWEQYKAECCDWEGAAVIKIAALNHTKALALRCISDMGCQDVYSEYKKNYKMVLSRSAPLLWDFINLLQAEE